MNFQWLCIILKSTTPITFIIELIFFLFRSRSEEVTKIQIECTLKKIV